MRPTPFWDQLSHGGQLNHGPTQFLGQLKMGPNNLRAICYGHSQLWPFPAMGHSLWLIGYGANSTMSQLTVGSTQFWSQLHIGTNSSFGPTEAHSAVVINWDFLESLGSDLDFFYSEVCPPSFYIYFVNINHGIYVWKMNIQRFEKSWEIFFQMNNF